MWLLFIPKDIVNKPMLVEVKRINIPKIPDIKKTKIKIKKIIDRHILLYLILQIFLAKNLEKNIVR